MIDQLLPLKDPYLKKLSYVILNGEWHWCRPRSNLMQQIQLSIPESLKPQRDKCDEVVCTISPIGA